MPKPFVRKTLRFALLVIGVLILGGLGGVVFDHSILPRLSALPLFEDAKWLRDFSDRTTIINRTEQVLVQEDDSVERIVSQPATAVVSIISVSRSALPVASGRALSSTPQTTTRTGVLLTNDGLIVTYANQVPAAEGATHTVLLFDGKNYAAEYVGFDSLTNLAFFRLATDASVPAIALSNSDDSRTGRRLIAIGNSPADYQNRIATGVLGNINRTFNLAGLTVSYSDKWEGVFQMDLPRPTDFVGGPVISYNGEMVGLVGTQTIDGELVDFLLPSNAVRASLQRIQNGSVPARPAFGAYYLPITKALALGANLPRDRGALVYSPSGTTGLAVLAGSPAALAGLQIGDIVTAVEGEEVNLDNPLPELLSRYAIGDRIEIVIFRNGQELRLPVQF